MLKKILCILLGMLILTGCSVVPHPGSETREATLPSTQPPVATQPPTVSQMNPEYQDCVVETVDGGVMIIDGEETIRHRIIYGDIYITSTGRAVFDKVLVHGTVYVHGKLSTNDHCQANGIHAYKKGKNLCSAYDGIHGEITNQTGSSFSCNPEKLKINENALDYAFLTWGKGETEIPTTTDPEPDATHPSAPFPTGPMEDAPDVVILSETETLIDESFPGDVYVTSTGDIRLIDVYIWGTLYVYGKVHISDTGKNTQINRICTYDFVGTCNAFDGTHGQVTGGPFVCKEYYVANDALDYAFQTWGKQ